MAWLSVPVVLSLLVARSAADSCDASGLRTPCVGKSSDECANNGCCWDVKQGQPSCFFQTPSYTVKSVKSTSNGVQVTIGIEDESSSGKFPGSPISPLQVDVVQETEYRLHVKITDPNSKRWEIPESILPIPPPPQDPVEGVIYGYQFPAVGQQFSMRIYRLDGNVTIFDTSSTGFIYANQLLQIGTTYSSLDSIYGFGEHKVGLKLNDGSNNSLTMWNYDGATPDHLNLYGSHPFYLDLKQDGSAHGVFLRNSNGMDVSLSDTAYVDSLLTYNVIGGVLDFYFFLGPQPGEVITQYHEVIGRPAMPPYWALGYHQCRYGFMNLQEVQDVVSNFDTNKIPLDTMWTDIDYMNQYRDFSNDPGNFPVASMQTFIQQLHAYGQHYVVIIDPGISTDKDYLPYYAGLRANAYIKDYQGEFFTGKVWPGETVFPDFADDVTADYWNGQITAWISEVPVDGLWIDMNEPSNFCNGACNRSPSSMARVNSSFDPNTPPYTIGNRRQRGGTNFVPLNDKTLDMDAVHNNGAPAYDMHNLYGFTESIATRKSLISIYGKRPFVLSRSTFAGSGVHAAHWLGDNSATSEDLLLSISTILTFQMFGIPLVGADICGFIGATSEELCARWMELGSFYPFSRNHNTKGAPPQEPYRWPSVAAISRKYLGIRYSLLPYYYTLFYEASYGRYDSQFNPPTGMVLHPLFVHFPTDVFACKLDTEFMVGGALLIVPQYNIGDEGKYLNIYLPQSVWYDWYTQDYVTDGASPVSISRHPTPLDYLPIYIRGGYIIPMQGPGLTTTESRKNPYSLIVAPDMEGRAMGTLYLDDGETIDTKEYTLIKYSCAGSELFSDISGTKYATQANLPVLRNVTVLGLKYTPTAVTLDGVPVNYTFTQVGQFTFVGRIVVYNLSINMDTKFRLSWM